VSAGDFLERIADSPLSALERAVALLWWVGREDPRLGMSAKEVANHFENSGHSRQNVSRLHGQLQKDRRTVKDGNGGWRLSPEARRALESVYADAFRKPRPLPQTDSVLPHELVLKTRGYIERVVEQINKSYDLALYDCCAVMCRRLLETLIIEVYESRSESSKIKGQDGHFLMLNGLVSYLENDTAVTLGRNGMKGLKDFKTLGDLAAHNRRFNAHKSDFERVRDGLRVAAEELIHLAGFRN
jgi:hypothetical protein